MVELKDLELTARNSICEYLNVIFLNILSIPYGIFPNQAASIKTPHPAVWYSRSIDAVKTGWLDSPWRSKRPIRQCTMLTGALPAEASTRRTQSGRDCVCLLGDSSLAIKIQ
jgi:hypothetical protein